MTGLFSDFYCSLDPDPGIRGRQFEHFVKWFLKTDPEWSTQVDQVWLWHEYGETACSLILIQKTQTRAH